MYDKYKPVRKVGAYNGNRTKKWDGKKWVPVNVVHKGQRATLNGKSVVADGKGNWRSPGTRGNSLEGIKPGKKAGSYQSGDRNRKPSQSSSSSRPSRSNDAAAINARLKKQKEEKAAALARTKGRKPASSTPSSPEPTRSTPTRSTPTKSTPKAATSANAQNLKQERSPDNPTRKPRTWLADNYKPGGPPKTNEAKKSLQIKPKKKKLTNKQRKQGGFH